MQQRDHCNLWNPKAGAPESNSYDPLPSIERILITLGLVSLAQLLWHPLMDKNTVFDLAGNGLE